MKFDADAIKAISPLFVDSVSHCIFADRILYGLTSEDSYIRSVIATSVEGSKLEKIIKKKYSQRKIIFGAGSYGKWLMTYFQRDAQFVAFVDNDKNNVGKKIINLPVISFAECTRDYSDCCIFVTPRYNYQDIYKQLLDVGFKKENIVLVGKLADTLAKKIYFDQQFIPHSQNEVFVDAGAFKGETVLSYLEWCKGNYQHIYCFEPSRSTAEVCKQNLRNIENVSVLPKGLWSRKEKLSFEDSGTESHIVHEGANPENLISAIDLDSVIFSDSYTNKWVGGGGIHKDGY